MRVEDRINQLAALCAMHGLDRKGTEAKAKKYYPNGPSPLGNGWTEKQLDSLYKLVSEYKESLS